LTELTDSRPVTVDQLTFYSGQRSSVSGQRSAVSGQRSAVIGLGVE
jgi:hypothetical protein